MIDVKNRNLRVWAFLLVLIACVTLAAPMALAGATTGLEPDTEEAQGEQAAVSSDQASGGGNVGFAVRAIIPENQRDIRQTYFDLRMQPSQQQDLVVEVMNSGNVEIEVQVSAISASTASNGLIDYRTANRHDTSLKVPFSSIATVQQPVMRIPAGQTQQAIISVNMPAESYDGVILGGLVFTKTPDSELTGEDGQPLGEDQAGTMITNVYSYVLGAVLNESDVEVLPDFELVAVEGELVDYSASAVHYIRNKEAAIAKDIVVSLEITKKGSSDVVHRYNREGLEMAPNSLMALNTGWDPGVFEAGDYTSTVHMEQGGRAWDFTMDFTIAQDQALRINEENLNLPVEANTTNWILILVIIVVVLLVLILVLWLIFGRKKKDDDRNGGGSRGGRSGSSRSSSSRSGRSGRSSGNSSRGDRGDRFY